MKEYIFDAFPKQVEFIEDVFSKKYNRTTELLT
jgi:hypothetical protein